MPDGPEHSLAPQIIELLYTDLLQRPPDPDAARNAAAFLEAGGLIRELQQMILQSPEYSRLHPALPDPHPLARFPALYTPQRTPYFTHRGQYRPLALTIETVNICNNACVICPYPDQTRPRRTMPMAIFEKALRDYAEIGGGPLGLTPMVGELFLDKLLEQRLGAIAQWPSITELSAITNASMVHRFSDERLAALLQPFTRITISIYGLDADEYRTMTLKDEYGQAFAGAARVLHLAGPAKTRLGARRLRQRPPAEITAWIAALAREASVPPETIRFDETLAYANWSHFDTSQKLPLDATWAPAQHNTEQCALPLVSAQILSDGTVSFCACADFDANTALVLGNVAATSLRDLFNSDKIRALWNWSEHGAPAFCQNCSFHRLLSVLAANPAAFAEPLRAFGS